MWHMTVSLVARRHGVAPNQLFTWRRLVAQGGLTAAGSGEEVVPASDYRALQSQVRELLAPAKRLRVLASSWRRSARNVMVAGRRRVLRILPAVAAVAARAFHALFPADETAIPAAWGAQILTPRIILSRGRRGDPRCHNETCQH